MHNTSNIVQPMAESRSINLMIAWWLNVDLYLDCPY